MTRAKRERDREIERVRNREYEKESEWEQGPERESTALFCLGFFFCFFLLILNQDMLRGIDNEIQYFSSKHKKKSIGSGATQQLIWMLKATRKISIRANWVKLCSAKDKAKAHQYVIFNVLLVFSITNSTLGRNSHALNDGSSSTPCSSVCPLCSGNSTLRVPSLTLQQHKTESAKQWLSVPFRHAHGIINLCQISNGLSRRQPESLKLPRRTEVCQHRLTCLHYREKCSKCCKQSVVSRLSYRKVTPLAEEKVSLCCGLFASVVNEVSSVTRLKKCWTVKVTDKEPGRF